MTEVDPLEIAAAQMAIGDLRSEDLPDIATDALVRGLDSPSLRLLAGQSRDDVRDSADLFRAVIDELDINRLDAESAHWFLVRRAAEDIVAGRVAPITGASQFWKSYFEVQDSGDLRIFIGLLSEYEDHPEDKAHTEAEIVTESRELISRPGPRRWITLIASSDQSSLRQTATPADLEIDASILPLSASLRADIDGWEGEYRGILGDWPRRGGFRSIADAERFVEQGARLAERLQDELGPTVRVEYYSEPIRPPGVKLKRSGWRRLRLRDTWHAR